MKNIVSRLFAGLMLVFACVCMWGCSDRVEFKWSDGRGTPLIAGFIDDSLVVAYDCRGWLETTETWNGGYSEDESCGHDRLLVYNYRVQEEGPRWSDSLTNERGGYRWFQLTDSIFWRWEEKNILLWKIGETAHEMKISRKNKGCSHSSKIERIHQWLDGTFIALGGNLSAGEDSCQYAVLDTISGTLTYKRLDKNLEWIKECDDVRAWGDDVYCLKRDGLDFLRLLVNYKNMDSILVDSISFWDSLTISLAPLSFYGNMFYWAYVNSVDSEKRKIKLNPNIRPLSFPSFGEFIDEKKKVISY
ncbi:hypothetical protein [Fibrobacter sp.]|uniref:hypothetical protein n=1 Tax=Fibrobacter sp. TaxID=35828 RepID=UPI00388FD553